MDVGESGRGTNRIGEGLHAALAAGFATALVFAAAALLALALVGPRYEASVSISALGEDETEGAAAVASTHEFRSAVAERLGADSGWQGEAATLPARLLALLDGRRPGTQGLGDAGLFQVAVRSDPNGERMTVAANAAQAEEAERLAAAVASELVDRSAARSDPTPAGSIEELNAARSTLADLRRQASALDRQAAATDSGHERLERLRSDGRDLDQQLTTSRERLDRLRSLRADPTSGGIEEDTGSSDLAELVARRNALSEATGALAEALPVGNPRLRIAQLRLDELQTEIATAVDTAIEEAEGDRTALEDRRAALSAELDMLENRASAGQQVDRLAEEQAARLRDAEMRVETLQSMLEPTPARASAATVAGSGSVREIAPPYLLTMTLAGLIGFVAGAVGVAAHGLVLSANRRGSVLRADPDTEWPGAEGYEPDGDDVRDEDRTERPDGDDPDEMSLDEAVAALSASRISRALLVSVEDALGPTAGLRLARALARDGQLVLLVDLSPSQASARDAGIPIGSNGFADVAAGSLGLSSVTFADEESAADVVSAGRQDAPSAGRTDALRFARRAYDQVVVDCGTSTVADVRALADENAAILVTSQAGADRTALDERLKAFEAAGLDAAVLRV